LFQASSNCLTFPVRTLLDRLDGGVPSGLDGRVAVVDRGAALVVVLPVRATQDGVVQAAGCVDERGLGAHPRLVLPAHRQERVPAGPFGGQLVPVGGQAGLLEQVGAVGDRDRADVGAKADHLAVSGGRRLPLPRVEVGFLAARAERLQVGELAGQVLRHVGDPADLDADHVHGALGRVQVLLQDRVVVLLLLDAAVVDRDVRVRRVVGVEQPRLLVAERAEQPDVHGDRTVRARRCRRCCPSWSCSPRWRARQRRPPRSAPS
jgi:hypothetical protein